MAYLKTGVRGQWTPRDRIRITRTSLTCAARSSVSLVTRTRFWDEMCERPGIWCCSDGGSASEVSATWGCWKPWDGTLSPPERLVTRAGSLHKYFLLKWLGILTKYEWTRFSLEVCCFQKQMATMRRDFYSFSHCRICWGIFTRLNCTYVYCTYVYTSFNYELIMSNWLNKSYTRRCV